MGNEDLDFEMKAVCDDPQEEKGTSRRTRSKTKSKKSKDRNASTDNESNKVNLHVSQHIWWRNINKKN